MIASVDHFNSTNTLYTYNNSSPTSDHMSGGWIIQTIVKEANFDDLDHIKELQKIELIEKEREAWKQKRKDMKKIKYPKWGHQKPKVRRY